MCACTCVCVCVYACACACVLVFQCLYIYVCVCVCVCVCLFVCLSMSIYIYMCVCVCACVCVCFFQCLSLSLSLSYTLSLYLYTISCNTFKGLHSCKLRPYSQFAIIKLRWKGFPWKNSVNYWAHFLIYKVDMNGEYGTRQGILKGEVSLYGWPPVWLVCNQLYDYW
jgi:hypothetical protein